ncbi:hypothetical protein M9H77_19668 [Catharanthus roseus]|uniref:Uncharacterized protein n=1 Tax=Catharanthus roseus TaxID=4058 RepID=A0ACC0BAX9_CATRO|nr:hypothetical protein M9H77_19668 [Catharanthus roseus]
MSNSTKDFESRHLVESLEGLETKVGLRADLVGALGICSLVWPVIWRVRFIDYEILELGSDDLVMGSGLSSWSPTVALHVLLNLSVEAVLMYLNSLRLPSCIQTFHVGSSISDVKATKEKCFLMKLHELLTQDEQRRSKPLK